MKEKELISRLYSWGHFWDSVHLAALNVTSKDLKKLTLKDRAVKEAVRSFQEADANYDVLSWEHHGRAPVADGEVGPATLALASLPRCPVPDHIPPVGVKVDDPDLQGIVESMRAWQQAGSGSWPAAGCDPNRRGVHSIRVRINTASAPAAVRGYLEQSLEHCRIAFGEMGLAVRYILAASGAAEIVKDFRAMSGGTIGWNYYPTPNSCRSITGAFNRNYSPDFQLWACLETHETGHGVGLPHTKGHIMNPSILRVWPLTWRGSPSEPRLRTFFGGKPIDPPTPVPPPTPEPPPVPTPPGTGKIVVDLHTREIVIPADWSVGRN